MKAIWVFAVYFAAATAEDYSKYALSNLVDHGHHESVNKETYQRRCGIVPNVFQCERADRSDTAFGEYPWQVAILNGYDKNSFVCSGALVSSDAILTSATCVKSLPESYLRVRLGEWDIATDKNPREAYANLELGVVKKTLHPQYSSGSDYYPSAYDVAILKLEYAVDFSSYPQISPVCLPSKAIDLEYAECFVAGWSESELNKIEVTQFVSQFWKVDLLNLHGSDTKNYKPSGHYPVDSETDKYMSYDSSKYQSKDYKAGLYSNPTVLASESLNLTSIPLVTRIKSKTLDDAQVLFLEKYECKESIRARLQPDQLCATGINGYDICKADLGSPIACIVPEHSHYSTRYRRDVYSALKRGFNAGPGSPRDSANGRMVVVGVTSLVYPCYTMEETTAIVTDVIKSLDFILKNIDIHDYYH